MTENDQVLVDLPNHIPGAPIHLTKLERRLLEKLADGQPHTRPQMVVYLYGEDSVPPRCALNLVSVVMHRLRAKVKGLVEISAFQRRGYLVAEEDLGKVKEILQGDT